MQKKLLLIMLFISVTCFSQISFEKGYFINNAEEKIDCYIKNLDWYNTPKSFEYKTDENSEILNADILNVKEFRVDSGQKYIRSKIKIDRASISLNSLGYNRNPEFKEETVFLKLLVDGNVQLFVNSDESTKVFFTGRNYENIEQLVYKGYYTSQSQTSVNYNQLYKTQLQQLFDCASFDEKQILNIDYNEKSLKKLIIKYDNCIDGNFTNQESKDKVKRDFFNLTLRPAINNSALEIENTNLNWTIDFGKKTTFALGLEAEFVLPYNKNKWAFTIEPTYHYYKGEKTVAYSNISGGELKGSVDYKSIELPIGIRHYFFLNDNSKIFINVAYVLDFSINSQIVVRRKDNSVFNEFSTSNRTNFNFGLGYKYKSYSVEFRASSSRNILLEYSNFKADYKNVAILFGYTIF